MTGLANLYGNLVMTVLILRRLLNVKHMTALSTTIIHLPLMASESA